MADGTMKIWECKIGGIDLPNLPSGADGPMRNAIEKAYYDLTGKYPDFNFSGWGANLTKEERKCVFSSEDSRYYDERTGKYD
jgi:hypothetical protein